MLDSFYLFSSVVISVYICITLVKFTFIPRLFCLYILFYSWTYLVIPPVVTRSFLSGFKDIYIFFGSSYDATFRFQCLFLILISTCISISLLKSYFMNSDLLIVPRNSSKLLKSNDLRSVLTSFSFLCILFSFIAGTFISSRYTWTSGATSDGGIFYSLAAYIKLLFVSLFVSSLNTANRIQIFITILLSVIYMFIDQSRTFFLQITTILFIWYKPNLRILVQYLFAGLSVMVLAGAFRDSSSAFSLNSIIRPFVGEFMWGSFSVTSIAELSLSYPYYPFDFDGLFSLDLLTPLFEYISKYTNISFVQSISSFKSLLYQNNYISSPFAPLEGSFYIVDWFLLFGNIGIILGTGFIFAFMYYVSRIKFSYQIKALCYSVIPIYFKATINDSLKYLVAIVLIFLVSKIITFAVKPLFVANKFS